MADQTEKPKLGTRPPLGLKRTVETGKVKQSFSHGRSGGGRRGQEAAHPRPTGRSSARRGSEAGRRGPGSGAEARPAAPQPRASRPSGRDGAAQGAQEKLLREAEGSRLASSRKRAAATTARKSSRRRRAPPRRRQPQGRGSRGRRARLKAEQEAAEQARAAEAGSAARFLSLSREGNKSAGIAVPVTRPPPSVPNRRGRAAARITASAAS